MMKTRLATLEDWPALKECWESMKKSPDGWKIVGEENILRAFFVAGLTVATIALPILVDEDEVKGFAVLQECVMPEVTSDGTAVHMVPHTFVRALYVSPVVPKDEAIKLEAAMESWASAMGHVMLCGNCRMGFRVKAMERAWGARGWKPAHIVVQKDLRGGA